MGPHAFAPPRRERHDRSCCPASLRLFRARRRRFFPGPLEVSVVDLVSRRASYQGCRDNSGTTASVGRRHRLAPRWASSRGRATFGVLRAPIAGSDIRRPLRVGADRPLAAAVRATCSTRARWRSAPSASTCGRFGACGRRPAAPSSSSRRRSACPAWRWTSVASWTSTRCRSTTLWSPHHGTRPTASSGKASMVASAWRYTARAWAISASRSSSAVVHRSASSASSSRCVSPGKGRSKTRRR